MTPRPDRCGTSSRVTPGQVGVYLCGLTVQSGAAHRSPALRRSTTTCCGAGCCTPATRSRSSATSPTSTTRSWRRRRRRAGRSGRIAYANELILAATYAALNVLPPTYEPRATGAHHRDARADHRADRARATPTRGRRRQRRRVLRRARRTRSTARCPGRTRTTCARRPTAASADKRDSARLRAVEGRQGRRAGRRLLAVAVGPRPAGLAHRVLGDGLALPRRRVRHPRRRARPDASRTTRTRSPSRTRPACRSPGTGCTTRCSTSARPR